MTDGTASDWIALLHGINVGRNNRLAMADLRAALDDAGFARVQTYIASGNVILRHPQDPATGIRTALRRLKCDAAVWTATARDFESVAWACPFPGKRGDQVHAFFCLDDPVIDRDTLQALRVPSEVLKVAGGHVWLHAPEGIGASRLAARMKNVILGTAFTARNLNTVNRLLEMLDRGRAG